MESAAVERLRARLAGRTKRELIEGMIYRSPHQAATERLVTALEVYPLLMLMLACDFPTRIWILDKGEKVSSASILDETARNRRWHSAGLRVDECEGLTEVVDGSVAVVVSWRSLLVMRHEFAHVITTFLPQPIRHQLNRLYLSATGRGRFTEPLAAESLGEYVACGVSYTFFDDLRQELEQVDHDLLVIVSRLVAGAEMISRQLSSKESDLPA